MNKSLIIHLVSEAIVLLSVTIYLHRKITGCNTEIKKLEQRLAQSEEMTKRCMMMTQQLYGMFDKFVASQQTTKSPTVAAPAATTSEASVQPVIRPSIFAEMARQQAEAMMMQQSTQEAVAAAPTEYIKKTTGPNMVESILTVLPTMMGPLMSANRPSMIIAELDRMAPPSSQQAKEEKANAVNVEVCNEEDDPDVAAALQTISSSVSSISSTIES